MGGETPPLLVAARRERVPRSMGGETPPLLGPILVL